MVCKHFPLYWSFVRGIHRSSFASPSRMSSNAEFSLEWRHNGRDGVSNHQPHDCLLNRLFRRRSKKTSQLRITGLCARNSPVTGEFPAQLASNAGNVSIWWRHHVKSPVLLAWTHDAHASDVTAIFFSKQILSFYFSSEQYHSYDTGKVASKRKGS